MKKLFISYFWIIIIFLVSLYSINLITDYMFKTQPFHFIGDAPIDLDNIIKVDKKPTNTKALLSYKNDSLIITLPKDAQYIQEIMPEINIINYKISKMQNKLITNYIVIDDEIHQSKIFEISKIIKEIMIISFIFLAGIISKPFTKKSYFLLSFNYIKQFLNKIIFFSAIVITIAILSNFLTEYLFIEKLFFIGVSSVIIANSFMIKWIKLLIFILTIFIYFIPFTINYNYIFFISIIINFIISYFSVKNINIINSKKIEEENLDD